MTPDEYKKMVEKIMSALIADPSITDIDTDEDGLGTGDGIVIMFSVDGEGFEMTPTPA